jgi:hypothetical protein
MSANTDWMSIAHDLFEMLDNIDTIDDIAVMVGASVRRQPWLDLPWWITPMASVVVLVICFWLGDRMFHRAYRG